MTILARRKSAAISGHLMSDSISECVQKLVEDLEFVDFEVLMWTAFLLNDVMTTET